MTLSTLRPNATSSNTGAVTGAGSAHAALSDDSDSSYVDFDNFETWIGGLQDLSLPAGALIKAVTAYVRVAALSFTPRISLSFPATAPFIFSNTLISWGAPVTISLGGYSAAGIADATIDAGTVSFSAGPSAGSARLYELRLDITYVTQPTVSVDGPTGTITDTNTPRVDFVATFDGDGGDGTTFQERIFTDTQYGIGGFDPATSPATASATVTSSFLSGQTVSRSDPTLLADGTYRAYVRVAQTVNGVLHWSDWDHTEFEVDVALPQVPQFNTTEDSVNGRIILEIADLGDVSFATTDYYEIVRETYAGPFALEPVRQLVAGPIPNTGPITVYDYEAPDGVALSYRGRALHDYSGAFAASDWDGGALVTMSLTSWWLKHPNQPALNVPVTVRSFPSVSRAGRQGRFQALGATNAVVISDTRGPKSGQVVLRAETLEDQTALDALLDLGEPLFLQSPDGGGGPGYIVFGNHDRARVVDWEDAADVFETLEFTVVASPSGDVVAWPP